MIIAAILAQKGREVVTIGPERTIAEAVAVLAAHLDYEFYKETVNWAIEARATNLGISKADLLAQLDEKVPGYNITFRELHRLPKAMKEK